MKDAVALAIFASLTDEEAIEARTCIAVTGGRRKHAANQLLAVATA